MKAKLLAIIDELKEKKIKLDNEIALLKSKKEIVQRDYDLAVVSLDEARKKIDEYDIIVEQMDEFMDEFIKEKDKIFKLGIETLDDLLKVIGNYRFISESVEAKLENNLKMVEKSREEGRNTFKRITEENERLSTMKADLDIYKKRIEKKYEELMPGQKIIL